MKTLLFFIALSGVAIAADYTVSTGPKRENVLTRAAQDAGATKTQVLQSIVNQRLDALADTHDKIDAGDVWGLVANATGPARNSALNTLAASITPPLVTDPGAQVGVVGAPFTLQIVNSDPDGLPLTYRATGLPAGVVMGTNSGGLIDGTPTASGVFSVTVRVTKLLRVFTEITFSLTVAP